MSLILLSGILGLAIGSFLNVVIFRLEKSEFVQKSPSFVKKKGIWFLGRSFSLNRAFGLGGRSYCPNCQTELKLFELVPVLSFIMQKRRCNYCKMKISWQYPLVEMGTAVVFVFVAWQYINGGLL